MSLIYNEIESRWRQSQKTCVITDGQEYKWSTLSQMIKERVRELPAPHKPFLFQTDNNLELLITFLACSLNGNIFFPLSNYRTELEVLNWKKALRIEGWELLNATGGVLFCTSGTTSTPKLVYHTEQNILENAKRSARDQKLNPEMNVGAFLTLAHSGGLNMQVIPALWAGCTLYLENRFSLAGWKEIEPMIDTCTLVPTQIYELDRYRNKTHQMRRLKYILTGSMVVPEGLFSWASQLGIQLLSVYGLTEIGPYVATTREFREGGIAPLGFVHPDFEFEFREQEIFLRGKSQSCTVSLGPDGPQFIESLWISTGDLGYSCGRELFFLGRKNRQINFSGFKYNPEEVEIIVQGFPGVERCALISKASSKYGQVGVLYFVGHASKVELRRYLSKFLASYKIPREIYDVDILPQTDLYKPAYQILNRGQS
jgi:fatty-acyl-CoA synthase